MKIEEKGRQLSKDEEYINDYPTDVLFDYAIKCLKEMFKAIGMTSGLQFMSNYGCPFDEVSVTVSYKVSPSKTIHCDFNYTVRQLTDKLLFQCYNKQDIEKEAEVFVSSFKGRLKIHNALTDSVRRRRSKKERE